MSRMVRAPRVRSSDYDGWFIYVAMCPSSDDEVLIKVGISTVPYDRLFAIHCNSPYPVELAYFSPVWTKKKALAVERAILGEFKERRTRGEWLKMDTSADTKKEFSRKVRKAIRIHTGDDPDWRKANGEQIRLAGKTKLGEKFRSMAGT